MKGQKQVVGSNFRCLISDTAITSEYVKTQGGKAGQIGQTLIAIVAEGTHGARFMSRRLQNMKRGPICTVVVGARNESAR